MEQQVYWYLNGSHLSWKNTVVIRKAISSIGSLPPVPAYEIWTQKKDRKNTFRLRLEVSTTIQNDLEMYETFSLVFLVPSLSKSKMSAKRIGKIEARVWYHVCAWTNKGKVCLILYCIKNGYGGWFWTPQKFWRSTKKNKWLRRYHSFSW